MAVITCENSFTRNALVVVSVACAVVVVDGVFDVVVVDSGADIVLIGSGFVDGGFEGGGAGVTAVAVVIVDVIVAGSFAPVVASVYMLFEVLLGIVNDNVYGNGYCQRRLIAMFCRIKCCSIYL